MRRKSKAKCQQAHARKRAMERYGIDLSRAKQEEIIGLIKANKAQFVEKQSNRITVFRVVLDDKMFRVVYDKQRKSLVTVLPQEEITDGTSC
jgi:hypothetical protein